MSAHYDVIAQSSKPYHILELIEKGKTAFLFKFSFIHESFPDIYAILPTIREANALIKMLTYDSEMEEQIENTIICKYVIMPYHRDWLNSNAPAGLLTSLSNTLLALALPRDIDSVNSVIAVARNSQDIFDSFKNELFVAGMSPNILDDVDVYKFFEHSMRAERKLSFEGKLEKPFFVKGSDTKEETLKDTVHKNKHSVSRVHNVDSKRPKIIPPQPDLKKAPSTNTNHGFINTAEENKRLAESGVLIDGGY